MIRKSGPPAVFVKYDRSQHEKGIETSIRSNEIISEVRLRLLVPLYIRFKLTSLLFFYFHFSITFYEFGWVI